MSTPTAMAMGRSAMIVKRELATNAAASMRETFAGARWSHSPVQNRTRRSAHPSLLVVISTVIRPDGSVLSWQIGIVRLPLFSLDALLEL